MITPEVGIWLARVLVDTNSSVYDWPELSAAFERAGIDAAGRTLNTTSTTSTSNKTGPAATAAAPVAGGSSAAAAGGEAKPLWPSVVRGWVTSLLRAVEVVVVPIEALDSRRQVEAGELCVRKSASNVDLNR